MNPRMRALLLFAVVALVGLEPVVSAEQQLRIVNAAHSLGEISGAKLFSNLAYGTATGYLETTADLDLHLVNENGTIPSGHVKIHLQPGPSTLLVFDAGGVQFQLFQDVSSVSNTFDANDALVLYVDATTLALDTSSAVMAQSTYCADCLMLQTEFLEPAAPVNGTHVSYSSNGTYTTMHSVNWPFNVQLNYSSGVQTQVVEQTFGYRGVYVVVFMGEPNTPSERTILLTNDEGERWWIPLVVAICILLGLALIWTVGSYMYEIFKAEPGGQEGRRGSETGLLAADPINRRDGLKKQRVLSLDTFRGGCLAIMIFVNYGGGGYWFFNHSWWNGLTVADLVFPWFIWIMGTSMALSLHGLKNRGAATRDLVLKICKRAATLFALGLFLNNGYDLAHWRIPGVLQYFAFAYLVCAVVLVTVPEGHGGGVWAQDFVPFLLQWGIILCFPTVWLAVTFGLDVPGCGRGYIGPGGVSDQGRYYSCTGAASTYVDRWMFGDAHFYSDPTCGGKFVGSYECVAHDPEGLLGSFNAVLMCWLGAQAGRVLLCHKSHWARVKRFLLWGVILGAIGCGLCGGKRDGGAIPVNKNLWSLSFIMVLGSGANISLALCYFIVDVRKWWGGMPLRALGMNSILMYMGHELLQEQFPFSFKVPVQTHGWLLFENLLGASCWVGISYVLFRNEFFFSV